MRSELPGSAGCGRELPPLLLLPAVLLLLVTAFVLAFVVLFRPVDVRRGGTVAAARDRFPGTSG